MCIHYLYCVQLYCQVVGDRTSTHVTSIVYISHETDDLLVLVIDYCVQQTVIHDSLEYMTLYAVAKYPMPHSKGLT